MNNNYHTHKHLFVIVASIAALLILPSTGLATKGGMGAGSQSWVGTIQGFSYVNGSKYYPVDASDPLALTEKMFVFVEGTGNNGFFLLENLNRSTLSAYIGKEVRLTGAIKQIRDRKIIAVDGVELRQGKQWRSEWSRTERNFRNHHVDF